MKVQILFQNISTGLNQYFSNNLISKVHEKELHIKSGNTEIIFNEKGKIIGASSKE